jgi:hypothetical protein
MPTHDIGRQPFSGAGASGLDIVTGRHGSTVALTLAGELDLHTVVRLRMRLAEVVAQDGSDVLVDLTGVTFMAAARQPRRTRAADAPAHPPGLDVRRPRVRARRPRADGAGARSGRLA